MNKPTKKKVMNEMVDYHDLINYIEEKYNIKVRDYANSHEINENNEIKHFEKYRKETGKEVYHAPRQYGNTNMIYRNGNFIETTKEEVEKDKKLLKEYHKWLQKNPLPPSPPYLDFWHWMINNAFYEVSNGTADYWNVIEILENEETPDWVKEITQLVYDEFIDELDDDGGLEVWISW